MSNSYELAILISLKDAASAGTDRLTDKLRTMGREGRQTLRVFEDLRKDMRQGLVMGGVGMAGLAFLNRGVKDAANFETSLLDLKSAFQEVEADGTVSLSKLGDQMNRAEKLSVDLGNKLQGSTKDYMEIFAALKKSGVDVETILKGAGRAAGYLSNVSGALVRGSHIEQAKELGQFGKMFNLKPEDFEKSVDLFSALKDRFDVESSGLIESAKYFQSTANSLNMTGLEGASESAKLFAILKREGGLEGSQAGTSATSFFTMFFTHQKELEKLKKATGINLRFTDKAGNFLGFQNAFKEMEQFRKLSDAAQTEWQNRVFGEQGGKVAGVMAKVGADGWKNVSAEAAKAVAVQDKINAQMETYNARMEALLGTVDNLKATTFTPLLNTMKPVLSTTNNIIGALQEWGSEHKSISSLAVHLMGVSSAGLVLVGTFKSMRSAYGLWKIASAVGGGDMNRLRDHFRGIDDETGKAGDKLAGPAAVGKWRNAGSKLGGAFAGAVKVSVAALAVEKIVGDLAERGLREVEHRQAGAEISDLAKQRAKLVGEKEGLLGKVATGEGLSKLADLSKRIAEIDEQIGKRATGLLGATRTHDTVGMFGEPSGFASNVALALGDKFRQGTWDKFWKDLKSGFYPKHLDTQKAEGVAAVKSDLASLKFLSGDQMRGWIDGLRKSGAYKEQEIELINKLAHEVYPAFGREVESTSSSTMKAAESLRVFRSELNLFELLRPPKPEGGAGGSGPVIKVPGAATGGHVGRGGLVRVHSGEEIVPAHISRLSYSGRATRGGQAGGAGAAATKTVNVTIHNINVSGGSAKGEDPRSLAQKVAHEVKRQVEKH